MAPMFVEALPSLVEGAGAAGEAGAAGAGEAAGGGGMMSKLGSLFKKTPQPMPGEQNKQQNVGESRTFNFIDAANSARNALRPGGIG